MHFEVTARAGFPPRVSDQRIVDQLKLHGSTCFSHPSRLWAYKLTERGGECRVVYQHDMDQDTAFAVSEVERPINLRTNITAAIVATR